MVKVSFLPIMSDSGEELFEMEPLCFEATSSDVSNDSTSVQTRNSRTTSFYQNGDSIDSNLSLRGKINVKETKKVSKKAFLGNKRKKSTNRRHRNVEDLLNGCKPFSICLTRLSDAMLKKLAARYALRTRSVISVCEDKSRAKGKHNIREAKHLQNENYSEKQVSWSEGNKDRNETSKGWMEISNGTVNNQCKVKRPLLDKNTYELKENQVTERVKKQALSNTVSMNENASEVHTKSVECSLKTNIDKVDNCVEVLETSSDAESECNSTVTTDKNETEIKEQSKVKPKSLQVEEMEYTECIRNFLMEHCMLQAVSKSTIFPEKYDTIDDKKVALSMPDDNEDENNEVIAWKYKRKKVFISSDSEDSHNEEMSYGKRRKIQRKHKTSTRRMKNVRNTHKELNHSTSIENTQTVYLSDTWSRQNSEKKLKDFIKTNTMKELRVDIVKLKDTCIPSAQIKEHKEMLTMDNCITESQLDNRNGGLPQCKDNYYEKTQLRLLPSTKSFSRSLTEHTMLKDLLSTPFDVTSDIPNSDFTSFNTFYKTNSQVARLNNKGLCSKLISSQKCIRDKESSLEDDKKYNAKVRQESNQEALLKAKYGISNELTVFLIRLEMFKNHFSNKYSASEIEGLMKKCSNFSVNTSTLRTPQLSEIVIMDVPCNDSNTVAACEPVSNYSTISYQPLSKEMELPLKATDKSPRMVHLSTNKNNNSLRSSISPKCLTFSCTEKNVSNIIKEETSNKGTEYHCQCSSQGFQFCEGNVHNVIKVDDDSTHLYLSIDNSLDEKESLSSKRKTTDPREKCAPNCIYDNLTYENLQEKDLLQLTEDYIIRVTDEKPLVKSEITEELELLTGKLVDGDSSLEKDKILFINEHTTSSSINALTAGTNIQNLVMEMQSEDSNEGMLTIDENDQKDSSVHQTSVSTEQNTFLNATIDKNRHEEQDKSQTNNTKLYKCINSEQLTKNHETSKEQSTKHTASSCNKRCNICRKDFANEVDLSKHSSVCRPTSKDSSTPKYDCSICDRKYVKEKQLEIHLRTKHRRVGYKLKNYDCNVCSQTFTSKERLSEHVFKHTPEELQTAYRIATGKQDPMNNDDPAENSKLINADTQDATIDTNVEPLQNVSCPVPDIASSNTADVELQESNEGKRAMEEDIGVPQLSGVDKDSDLNWISMCFCHRNEDFTNNGDSLQIEIGLHCQHCNILYKRRRCFETHFRTSLQCRNGRTTSRKPQMFCNACQMVINSLSDMRNHLGVHQHLNLNHMVTFICHICKVVFFSLGSLFYSHWYSHSKNMLFVASRYSFPKTSVIKNPRSDELTINAERGDYLFVAEYFCTRCKMPFSNEVNLQKHEREFCRDSLVEARSKFAASKFKLMLICSICNGAFNSKFTFDHHSPIHEKLRKIPPQCTCILISSGHTIYVCDACCMELPSVSEFEKHWPKHRMVREKFWCEYCNKFNDTLEKFLEHWKVHLFRWGDIAVCRVIYDDVKFRCKPCKLGFECQSTLDKHCSFHGDKSLEESGILGIEANRIDESSKTLVTADAEDDITIEAEVTNVVPETLKDSNVGIESSTRSTSWGETSSLPNGSVQNNTRSETATANKEGCADKIFNAEVGITGGSKFIGVVVMNHAERSKNSGSVGSLNDYIIANHDINSRTSTTVAATVDSSKPKINVPKFHIVILNQDRTSSLRSVERTSGNAELMFRTGEGNAEQQNTVAECSHEHDPLAVLPFAERVKQDHTLIISEDVVKAANPSNATVVKSKLEDQRPSVIERTPPVEVLEQMRNEETPKQMFLRVKSLTELQEMRQHVCNVCQQKFDSSKSLQQHFQKHIPITIKEFETTVQCNNTVTNVADSFAKPLITTPDIAHGTTSNTGHQGQQIIPSNSAHVLLGIAKDPNNSTIPKNVDDEVQPVGNSLSDSRQSGLPCTSTQSENASAIRYPNYVITTKSIAQKLGYLNKNNPSTSVHQNGGTVSSALLALSKMGDKQTTVQFACPSCRNFQHTSADEFKIHLSACQGQNHVKRSQFDQGRNCSANVNKNQSANGQVPKALFFYEQRQLGSDARIYGCNACPDFKCSNGAALSEHIKWHAHRKRRFCYRKRFSCMTCDKFVCESEEAIRQHVATHVKRNDSAGTVKKRQQPQLSRKSCDLPLQTTEIVNGNGGSTQIDNVNTSKTVSFSNVFYKCQICNSFQYSSNEELLYHLLEVHATSSNSCCYVCDYCTHNLAFSTEDTLRLHVDTYHNYVCKLCSKRFASLRELLLHEFVNHTVSTKAPYK